MGAIQLAAPHLEIKDPQPLKCIRLVNLCLVYINALIKIQHTFNTLILFYSNMDQSFNFVLLC